MRSTDRQPLSVAPGVYESVQEWAEARCRIQHWERDNPKVAQLSDKFDDLVFFELPLREIMSRTAMIARLGDKDSPPFNDADLKSATSAWSDLSKFYGSKWRAIAHDVASVYETSFDDLNAFVRECAALETHQKQIEAAHQSFSGLITALLKMGYSYSSIAPAQLGRRYYQFRT